MSMISAQCDELRRMAEQTDWEIPEAAMLMRQAADTIWELRCKIVGATDQIHEIIRLKAKNERLREENEKLRELMSDTLMDTNDYAHKYGLPEHGWKAMNNHLNDRMQELGIEVTRDGGHGESG